VAVLVEAGPLPGRGMVLPMGLDRPAEERWLSQQPPQVIVHLPIPQDDRLAPYVECTRMLYSTYHWHRLVNGYSGFVPDDMVKLTKTVAAFPDRPSLNALRARGVTLIILHRDLYDEAAWQQIARALPAHAQALETVGWFGEALVLRLKPEAGGR